MLAAFLTNEYVYGVVMLLSLILMMKEFLDMTIINILSCCQSFQEQLFLF